MSFGSPAWLWALSCLPLLVLLLTVHERRRRARWRRLAAPQTRGRIDLARAAPVLTSSLLIVLAVAATILALARPRLGSTEEELETRGLDLVIALDLSRSMLAEDIAPSRLVIARAVAGELAQRLPSDRVGLIGFAGRAASLCPLTLDRGALELYLLAADPSVFSTQGTDIGAAVTAATEMFTRHGRARRVLVLLTDGEDQEAGAAAAARMASENGITVYAVGIGTAAGAPIPERDEKGRVRGYRRDRDGQTVSTRLDEATLLELTQATGGAYARATGFGQELEQVVGSIERLERDELAEVLPRRAAERYRWPLTVALLAALAEAALVRRRKRETAL